MAKNIEPKLKKIGDYLKLEEDTVFTIPEYQRAYSWGIDNCDKLWQDINDFAVSRKLIYCFIEPRLIKTYQLLLLPLQKLQLQQSYQPLGCYLHR